MEKYARLAELADELGISISFYGGQCVVIDRDRDQKLPTLYFQDLEDGHPISTFPYELEYKMICDNPVFLAEQKKELEERVFLRKEEMTRKAIVEETRKAAEEKCRAEEKARKERALLTELKQKYE